MMWCEKDLTSRVDIMDGGWQVVHNVPFYKEFTPWIFYGQQDDEAPNKEKVWDIEGETLFGHISISREDESQVIIEAFYKECRSFSQSRWGFTPWIFYGQQDDEAPNKEEVWDIEGETLFGRTRWQST